MGDTRAIKTLELPFLKWPGGKRWASSQICDIVRTNLTGRYFEPFLGGGAVFFRLAPERAVLSDLNTELIEVYSTVKERPEELVKRLRAFPTSKEFFYELRSSSPRSATGRAARFLYLNRTAFGGIFRVNQRGEFNVPYGGGERDHRVLYETDMLQQASTALQNVELRSTDFAKVMNRLRSGDVAYCDPTYSVAHENNGFVRYNERNFSWKDQQRLEASARLAQKRGATVIVSNAYHTSVRELFASANRVVMHRNSMVSTDVTMRRPVKEYLFVFEGEDVSD